MYIIIISIRLYCAIKQIANGIIQNILNQHKILLEIFFNPNNNNKLFQNNNIIIK